MNPMKRSQAGSRCDYHMANVFAVRKLIIILLFMGTVLGVYGQDLQYSQFHNAPFLLNPGLAGVFNGDMRLTANYRNQWNSVPVRFNSFTAGFDIKHLGKKPRKGFFSTAYVFQFDKGGDLGYYRTNVEVIGSYTRRLSQHMYASVGLSVAPVFQGFDHSRITTDSQYDPESGMPNGSIGEPFPTGGSFYMDLSTGINFRYQKLDHYDMLNRHENRTRMDFGVGIFHINRPDVSFIDGGIPDNLPIRYSPYFILNLQLGREIDLFGAVRALYQRPNEEYISAVGLKFFLSRQLGKVLTFQFGSGFRFYRGEIDAYIPNVEVTYNAFQFGFSYDINLSDFNIATQSNGGPVVYFAYILKKVQPLPTHKTCPII